MNESEIIDNQSESMKDSGARDPGAEIPKAKDESDKESESSNFNESG